MAGKANVILKQVRFLFFLPLCVFCLESLKNDASRFQARTFLKLWHFLPPASPPAVLLPGPNSDPEPPTGALLDPLLTALLTPLQGMRIILREIIVAHRELRTSGFNRMCFVRVSIAYVSSVLSDLL